MLDIRYRKSDIGGENMGSCCESTHSCAPRNFLTKEEKVEMLQEYKESLEKEIQAVKERVEALKKE